jgi:hypothetical protein
LALVVPHKGAVLLKGRDGDGLVLQHPGIIGTRGLCTWRPLVCAKPQTVR